MLESEEAKMSDMIDGGYGGFSIVGKVRPDGTIEYYDEPIYLCTENTEESESDRSKE